MANKNKEQVVTQVINNAEMAAQATSVMQKTIYEAEASRKNLLSEYKNEEKVAMYLAPLYAPYFGNVMRVTINGISIYFKVDGSTQLIPSTFADEITARRMHVDEIIRKQGHMADVSTNVESSPGELELI